MINPDFEQTITAWLDGRINEYDSALLQQRLRESPEARAKFGEFTKLDSALRELASGESGSARDFSDSSKQLSETVGLASLDRKKSRTEAWVQLAIAASVLVMVGGIAYRVGKSNIRQPNASIVSVADRPSTPLERTIAGHATLRRVADIRWSGGADSYREGDVLPAGVLEFESGVAEIDFFCGATVVVEGPAKMDLESDWSVRFLEGRLRASVPPAARGFVVKAADSEIIDLGTEFALDVAPGKVRVEVIDGEVKLRGGDHDGDHLVTGEGQTLMGSDVGQTSLQGLSTIGDVQRRRETEQQQRFAQWKTYSEQLRTDQRLIAYYPIAESNSERFVPNMASTGHKLDGTLVGLVNRTSGRFGSQSAGLEFDRPGSRVRARIDGEFQALTFSCWAKIDSLDHLYNALFMSDGYETGELHWQIRNDGSLMFSVMVDDTQSLRHFSKDEQRTVNTAGLARVYYSKPFWDVSKSGQWFHVAAVYDPVGRHVVQYVNGEQLSSDEIVDKFYVNKLRIGPAEIGNWGQPFRETPGFAVRNLNGAIDELAIFNAALTREEIHAIYEQGKPLGY